MSTSRLPATVPRPLDLMRALASLGPCPARSLAHALGIAHSADVALGLDLLALRGLVRCTRGAPAAAPLYALNTRGFAACRQPPTLPKRTPANRRAPWLALAPLLMLAASCAHWPATGDPSVPLARPRPALPAPHGVMQRERAGELIFQGCPSQGCPEPSLKTRPAAAAPAPVPVSAPLPGDRTPTSGLHGAPVPAVAVFFGTGKARIDAGGLALLDAMASKAIAGTWRLKVTGRTDSRGAPAVNTRLAEARARAVARHLQRRGIEARRIDIATDIREDSLLRDGVRAATVPPDAQARARRADVSVERTV